MTPRTRPRPAVTRQTARLERAIAIPTSGTTYCFNSTKGGSVTTTATPVTAYRAGC